MKVSERECFRQGTTAKPASGNSAASQRHSRSRRERGGRGVDPRGRSCGAFYAAVSEQETSHGRVPERVAVVGVTDERFGQRLKAYVVAAEDAATSEEELKELVRARLAPFEVAREIEFVSERPQTESGKLIKVGLGRPRRSDPRWR